MTRRDFCIGVAAVAEGLRVVAAMNGRAARSPSVAGASDPVKAQYTSDVAARPPVRGVMLSQFTVGEDDFRTLKEWGATVARCQMYPVGERWKGKASDTEGFAAWLDWKLGVLKGEALPLARKYGIPLVVDLHVPPGGRGGSGMKMLDDPVWAGFFVDCWRKIATQLKGEGGVYAYDLINEPTQFGAPKVCDRWIADVGALLNAYGWDWCYHAFREWPGWSVEHVVTEGDSAATAKFAPSADNSRRRALLSALRDSRK